MLTIKTPTKVYLDGYESRISDLRKFLTFRNHSIEHEYRRFSKVKWFSKKFGELAFQNELKRLRDSITVCLLKQEGDKFWTYSGLAQDIADRYGDSIVNEVIYPEAKGIPWFSQPKITPRYYQVESKEKLIGVKHGGVEIGTGLGKSFIIMSLAKHFGLKTVIMAPSISIARQLLKDFTKYLGGRYVGLFGDGVKKYDKLFTIGIAASLTKVKPGSPEFKELSKAEVFIVDESHLCPADTLANVCFNLCAAAPYRFFFSGTQMRNDGQDLLLDGITGPIVYHMTVRQGVDEGFLSKPHFKVIRHLSMSGLMTDDIQEMVDEHFYKNPYLNKEAAELANRSFELLGHQVLILIEHVEQFQYLIPHLKHETGFAHGGLNKDNKIYVPEKYQKSDPEELVDRFNAGELPILVGTSCIGTGTDIRPCKTVINLQGGQSEVKIRQAIGRGTRRTDDKTEFNYVDFDVILPNVDPNDPDLPSIMRHARERKRIYNEVYGPLEYV